MSIKYLSPSGLTEVWSNIKAYIASKIPSKIITGLSIKGRTITYTNSDGTTGTLTTQDTNTTYSVATTSTNGLMSSTDKTKLDGIAAGANNYTHPSSHPASMITGLTKVATSGSYNDLTNKPTIPTVNNATLTIQKNGTTVKTFTANASANVTANITVPTKTSELTNNSGFLTSHSPVDSSLSSTSTNAIQNKVVNTALNTKANDADVVHKSGNETINGVKKFTSETVNTSLHALRHIYGDYGTFWRQDGTNLYLMLTNRGDQYGNWNDFRPLTVNLATGTCGISGNAATATKATQDASGNVITTTYAKDANVVHKTGNETIAGLKTFSAWQIINMGLNVKWITGNKEQKSLHLFGSMDDKYQGFGSVLELHGDDANYGMFTLIAKDKTNTNVKQFVGLPDGTLTWGGKHIVRTVNGVGANQAGNVNLTNILGFTPVQQGGGTGQLTNKIYIGWTGSQLKCTVDKTDLGAFVFEGRAQVGTTITAYWGSSSSTGNKWASASGLNGTKRVSSTTNTFTPVVGQIYSGNQLYSTVMPGAGIGDTGVHGPSPEVVYARLDLSGAFNSSYKYLCTTAVGVNATASVDVTGNTVYGSSGPHTTITSYGGLTKTVQGGKSTFLRVQ